VQELAEPLVGALGRAVLTGETPVVVAALPLLADACQFQRPRVRAVKAFLAALHSWDCQLWATARLLSSCAVWPLPTCRYEWCTFSSLCGHEPRSKDRFMSNRTFYVICGSLDSMLCSSHKEGAAASASVWSKLLHSQ